jgi:hypothetical protein
MKNLIIGALVLFILTAAPGCKSSGQMTGKEYIKKEQQYYNYEAAMDRAKKAKAAAEKEAKKEAKKSNKKGGK